MVGKIHLRSLEWEAEVSLSASSSPFQKWALVGAEEEEKLWKAR